MPRTATGWSYKLPSTYTPSKFAAKAEADHGVTVNRVTVSGKTLIHLVRFYGDMKLELVIVDIPVRMPASHLIASCRDLQLPLSDFGLTAHDLQSADFGFGAKVAAEPLQD